MRKKRGRSDHRKRFLGLFQLGGRSIAGELALKGAGTLLTLHDSELIAHVEQGACIAGTAYSGEHITLVDCRSPGLGSTRFHDGREIYHAEVFPHYVVLGDGHIQTNEACVSAIHFTCTDLNSLFYDFDAFGHVINAKSIIDAVLEERRQMRPVESGEAPLVCYFTGRERIVDLATAIGRVSVYHSPSYNVGGPGGVYIRNRIWVSIETATPVVFDHALDRVRDIACFFSVAAGRQQGVDNIQLLTTYGSAERPLRVDVRPSYRAKAPKDIEQRKPHPADVPLDPIHYATEFNAVLTDWIRRHDAWRVARARYLDCLRKDNTYDTERLVAAANMFDILPPEAVPAPTKLADDLAATKATCEEAFRKHPEGIDRNSALSALGRLGKPSLPKKVAHRVSIVDGKLGARFPDLQFVATIAVRCRNFLVHGSDEIDYQKLEHLVPFLTDALEFIFAASDLLDSGWDAQRWDAEGHSWGHSFARFRWGHQVAIAELRRATEKPSL